ncbi:MAG: XdhC family protein [Nocardioidaceae bacterium]|nr:XdhC family protein [Nocardioidaceae bacterium]NUS51336.1 XdhC family protein [Nocardioidaceae bacterium]
MSDAHRAPAGREQPWSDDAPEHGRVVVVTDNPIGRAVVEIARVAGRETVLLADEGVDQLPADWLAANPLTPRDAFVMCDHDTPGMEDLLRSALAGEAGYVAMMGSRRRAERVFAGLQDLPAETLARLHVPAGLNTGGKGPGEIALSVVAEVVAVSYGRDGGPMRTG